MSQYLASIHVCVHPVFADALDRLETTPSVQSAEELHATVAFVVEGATGKLADAGIVASSGVPLFDAAALASSEAGFPDLLPPPDALSPDGHFYFTWEFQKNPAACTSELARALIVSKER